MRPFVRFELSISRTLRTFAGTQLRFLTNPHFVCTVALCLVMFTGYRAGAAEVAVLRHDDWIFGATFSPGGSRLVTTSGDHTARLWDAATGGIEAANRGDYQTALEILRSLADEGDAQGQTGLGRMYHQGWGVPQDYAEAAKWYRKAADQGYAKAQNSLGTLYDLGLGVPHDDEKAANWFRMGAEQDFAPAQYNLGNMYLLGAGVEQEDAEAVKWFRMAADKGNAGGQNNLGFLYEHGRGVEQDIKKAVELYRQSAAQGYADAQFNLGALFNKGKGVVQDFAESATWFRMAAKQGHANSQHELATAYINGEGVPLDYAKAAIWFRRAAEQGHPLAQYDLGYLYRNGQGVAQDHSKAVNWYRLSAEQGYALAQFNLGMMYFDGRGVSPDYFEAFRWFQSAAEQHSVLGRLSLGEMYRQGSGVPQDIVTAYMWFGLAAQTKAEEAVETGAMAAQAFQMAVGMRDGMSQQLSPDQIGNAKLLANDFVSESERPYLRNARYCRQLSDMQRWNEALVECKQALATGTFPSDQESDLNVRVCYSLISRVPPALADAEPHCNTAVNLDPTSFFALNARGALRLETGKVSEAIADYTKAIEIDPKYAGAYNNLAWILATASHSEIRDGEKAVELAEKAVELKPQNPIYLDTLAAGYAGVGRFDEAVHIQQRAIDLFKAQGKTVADHEDRLKLYEQKKPFRLEQKADADQ